MICSIIQTNPSNRFALFLDFGIVKPTEGARGARATGPSMWAALDALEKELKEGPEGGFFMGEKMGRCDILAEFPLAMIKQRGWVDLEKQYPALDGWLGRVYARDAWKRGLEKGNGYDLTTFPKVPERQ